MPTTAEAINVCYDSEFPLFARRQVERGADLILVPSCTDTAAGYNRVRIGCRVGAWSEAVDRNVGQVFNFRDWEGQYGPLGR